MSGAIVIDGIAQYVPQVTDLTEQILIARDTEPAGQPLPDANRKQIQAMIWAMKHANASRAKGANAMPGMNMGSTRARMTMGSAIEVLGRTNSATRNPFVAVEARYRRMSRKRFDASDGHCVGPETPARALTLNGASVPSISIQPGVQQFWRMVNAGSDTYLDVSLDNASLQIVSIDGVPISSGINTPTSLTVPDYVLPVPRPIYARSASMRALPGRQCPPQSWLRSIRLRRQPRPRGRSNASQRGCAGTASRTANAVPRSWSHERRP